MFRMGKRNKNGFVPGTPEYIAEQEKLFSNTPLDAPEQQVGQPVGETNDGRLEEHVLLDNLGKIAYTLDKTYLSRLETDYGVLHFVKYNKGDIAAEADKSDLITYASNIRALRVKRWVYDRDEKIGDCFKNVLSVFAGSEQTIALVLHRTPQETEMYFVTKNSGLGLNEVSSNCIDLLGASLRGNFPGSSVESIDAGDTKDLFDFGKMEAASCLCNIPSEKSEDYLCQGIDKLLNSIVPDKGQSYYVVIMATPLSREEQREVLRSYEDLATAIAPFSSYQFQVGKNNTETFGEMDSRTHTEGISTAVTKTHSINTGLNANLSGSIAKIISDSITSGWNIGAHIGDKIGISGGYHRDKAHTESEQIGHGGSIGASVGYGYSWGRTDGRNVSAGETKGRNHSVSLGTSESTTYTYQSYLVKNLLEKLEATIKRIDESQSTGLWKTASYVLAPNLVMSRNIANFLRSITQGDESYIEPSAIQSWAYENHREGETTAFGEIVKYLSHFSHPVFLNIKDGTAVTPTSDVSTTELSNTFAFPRYSVQGVPVIQCARFGREPHSLGELSSSIRLGQTYHMHQIEKEHPLAIDKKALTAHTFITGSTGAGKSNTIYKLLDELCFKGEKPANFLVIEPAKGEYKDVFGGRDNVSVYGTNPKKAPLLRLNPFSFPDDIHVLEHIDRLVEVFNACWPMYAAMPAVLKDAIEASYVSCGWSLTQSTCAAGQFPTFATLLKKLPEVMKNSAYSKDTKGDYTGALATRVKSLTNGINGQIFCSEEDIPDTDLFDRNVIVDLSRVGSMETKALLMGMLMIKLQEYRMAEAKGSNAQLRHVTVLEEAHNLLRRTSSEQSQESSNLQGKSVEMLANAIAEMRTYGEGFIIADQAPGLLDMAVIRNTNTKIIMRLPDESDRQLVGKAAGLNDDQIVELARLDVGVAAVFQNHWLEPVLCKVDEFTDKRRFAYVPQQMSSPEMDALFARILYGAKDGAELSSETVDRLKHWVARLDTGTDIKELLRQVMEQKMELSDSEKGRILYCLLKGKSLMQQIDRIVETDVVQSLFETTVVDILRVSAGLVPDIKKLFFLYASNQTELDDVRRHNLMEYGGIK